MHQVLKLVQILQAIFPLFFDCFRMIRVFFDTETSGLPSRFGAPADDLGAWDTARLVQLSWIIDQDGEEIGFGDLIVKPEGFTIPEEASKVHGITTEVALEKGVSCKQAVYAFLGAARLADELVGHNVEFDMGVVGAELVRHWKKNYLEGMRTRDTMKESVEFCRIEKASGRGYKWPKLMELYQKLFGQMFQDAHNSLADVTATRRCFWELTRKGIM